ncbi:FRG domain-containing protein [Nonomuraea sp. SBT364]|uniref:FRG domain-containing protein n=1 Tax=Nonomuraea sp. SBT364 TaxID=1580530 RepID=UPI0007C739E6|nr:FRG domain-containing protein [Nonomuraea sp. SBT364]
MKIDEVSSWRDLDDAVARASEPRGTGHAHSAMVFRGLARASYTHVSSLSRLRGDYAALERHLVRNFRKYAHCRRPGSTVWDWLALGQHHGLPTRLLDWTFSPLVALHFATASWPEDDAVLLGVDCHAAHRLLPEPMRAELDREGALLFTTEMLAAVAGDLPSFDRLSEEPFLVFFEPPSLDERVVNQSSVLSAMSRPTHQVQEWLGEHPGLWRAWSIPAPVKAEVRERLDQAGVTERVLLPGLDGLAAWLRRYYTPGSTEDGTQGGAFMSGTSTDRQREGWMGA